MLQRTLSSLLKLFAFKVNGFESSPFYLNSSLPKWNRKPCYMSITVTTVVRRYYLFFLISNLGHLNKTNHCYKLVMIIGIIHQRTFLNIDVNISELRKYSQCQKQRACVIIRKERNENVKKKWCVKYQFCILKCQLVTILLKSCFSGACCIYCVCLKSWECFPVTVIMSVLCFFRH